LQIFPGEKLVVRGPSGCGKSSLLKCVVGAFPILEGSVRIDGMELCAKNIAEIRARIAFIGQEPILGAENVREALLLPFSFKAHHEKEPIEKTIVQTLERLHLSASILDKPSKRISGGEKQRIAIARALLLGKNIFLADETTSALDPESKAATMDELFRPGTTLLSVSHDPDWIGRCDRIVGIENMLLKESGLMRHRHSQNQNNLSQGAKDTNSFAALQLERNERETRTDPENNQQKERSQTQKSVIKQSKIPPEVANEH
jgi:putative ABC transport system ATP-binding protein